MIIKSTIILCILLILGFIFTSVIPFAINYFDESNLRRKALKAELEKKEAEAEEAKARTINEQLRAFKD